MLAVLKVLRSPEPVSRADLPARTGLSAGTITAATTALVKRGFIVERKAPAAGRGRPRVYLELNGTGGTVIGARLSDRRDLQVSFVTLAGVELHAASVAIPPTDTLLALAEQIACNLQAIIAAAPMGHIRHVSLSLPALVDSERGDVHFMVTYQPGPVPFATILAERLLLPVTVENDSNLLSRAEHWFGHARHHNDFTLISIDYAVTSARYVDGLPSHGSSGYTPELGHIKTSYGRSARRCYCGASGCTSAYSSKAGLVLRREDWATTAPALLDLVDARMDRLMQKASQGEQQAVKALEEAGEHLGRMVADHVNSVDPGMVLLIAPNDIYLRFAREQFHAALAAHAIAEFRERTTIVFATRQPDWHWKGLAALALERVYLQSH